MILILSLSSLFMVYQDVNTIQADTANSYYYHLSQQEVDGILWLGRRTDAHDVILTNWFISNLIPGFIGRTVYIGHRIQTIDFDKKIGNVNQFLHETNNAKAESFLKTNRITYIYFGIGDSLLSYGFKPDTKSYLSRVYASNGVMVYKVK